MKVNVKKVNAFTDNIKGGNPAGVVLDSPDLNEKQMAFISRKMKVSETAFVFPSNKADFKNIFFTPEIRVDLCGHATIATFFTMASEGFFKKKENFIVTQETDVGILPVHIEFLDNGSLEKVMMEQNKAILKDIHLDISEICESLKISKEDIDTSLPKQIVSTGLFTLPICISSLKIMKNLKPNFEKIKLLCKKLNVGSFHLYTFDTIESKSLYHARNFAPIYGVNEDPVTGTANGAVCSYLIQNDIIKGNNFVCEQGDIIKRSGRVFVEISEERIKVGGRAKFVEEIEIIFS